jgi:ABC-type polysaccharide/polyol phosphate transport system ATPase subunit
MSSVLLDNVCKIYQSPVNTAGRMTLRAALRNRPGAVEMREIRAVDGVSLQLREGDRLGIIGRNGAGKSTLLHLIAGLSEPTAGRIRVDGHVHAIMTLGTVLREEVTGRENIYLDGAIQNRTRAEIDGIVDAVIAFSELGPFIDRPVRTYSTGMKARLAFSMIAFIEPEILVIDEALSVGDVHFAAKASRRMRELSAAGRIVIIVSHGLSSIVEMCNRCLWLDGGRVMADGPPQAVTTAYERAVSEADEAALQRKFSASLPPLMPDAGAKLTSLRLCQDGVPRGSELSLRALADVFVEVEGRGSPDLQAPDLSLRIVRIDGTAIADDRLSRHADPGDLTRPFRLRVAMRPLVLGQHAYRLDALLLERGEPIAGRSVVFEVRDEEGQMGGVPMILYPPLVNARAREEVA